MILGKGLCAYPGEVTGQLMYLPMTAVPSGEVEPPWSSTILLTDMTTPVMVPLMSKCTGVITKAGGVLCHAAIIAREYKIPTIVGMGGWFNDWALNGVTVTINPRGALGEVEICTQEEERPAYFPTDDKERLFYSSLIRDRGASERFSTVLENYRAFRDSGGPIDIVHLHE